MLTRLCVLGFLFQRPMSGYEIQNMLQLSQTEQWAGILPGSIYHALKKLHKEGLVTLERSEQSGNRTKSIYAITLLGKEEFHRLLQETWKTPVLHFPVRLYAAISFFNDITFDEVLKGIDNQIDSLQKELNKWNEGEVIKSKYLNEGMPEYLKTLFSNGRKHIEIDIEFLKYLRETLPNIKPLPLLPREYK